MPGPKSEQLAEYLLFRLHQLAEEGSYRQIHDLDPIAAEIDVHDTVKVMNVANALERRGLIHCANSSDGSSARILAEGAFVVEEASKDRSSLQEEGGEPRVPATSPRSTPSTWQDLLHSTVGAAAFSHYTLGHYREAVLNAVTSVFDLVRERTGLDLDGDALVTQVFSVQNPLLEVANLKTDSGRNDQVGFMMMLQGLYRGVRNPKAHSLHHDLDAMKAAEYLVITSFFARRIKEAKLRKPRRKKAKSRKA